MFIKDGVVFVVRCESDMDDIKIWDNEFVFFDFLFGEKF